MKRSEFHFELPSELIAQRPRTERDGARLLVIDANSGAMAHSRVRSLPEWVPGGTLCVPNDVRVRRARLLLRLEGGGRGEALLHRGLGGGLFEALLRPGAKLRAGKTADVMDPRNGSIAAKLMVEEYLGGGSRAVRLAGGGPFDWDMVDSLGLLPLPPYIRRPADAEDDERYQTVFSREGEAVAAPTAGLHFTPSLIDALKQKGCLWLPIRLHIGLGTFRPIAAEDIDGHDMHEERFEMPGETAEALAEALAGGTREVLAIGTTSLRAMEAAWRGRAGGEPKRSGTTSIFIRPGYRVCTADHLLTNFHLPESTLFVLVSAILGLELAKGAYQEAMREGYSFFSFGDAMLIKNIRRAGAPPCAT
jgi:S-adenosylmethionine:tRNA ribosyltransferase-isomerase